MAREEERERSGTWEGGIVGFLHSELHSLTIGFKKKKERKKE